jgi:predicted transcriptional regulator
MPSISFTLRMDAGLKQQLEAQARLENRSAGYVLQRAAEEYLGRQRAFADMLDRLEAEADKGAFVSGEAMTTWFGALDHDVDTPPPAPDVFVRRDSGK